MLKNELSITEKINLKFYLILITLLNVKFKTTTQLSCCELLTIFESLGMHF